MKEKTEQHLKASKAMPRKEPCLWFGEKEDKKYRRNAKRQRKLIARFYWVLRKLPEEGDAKLCHRYQVVATGGQAKTRLNYFEEILKRKNR